MENSFKEYIRKELESGSEQIRKQLQDKYQKEFQQSMIKLSSEITSKILSAIEVEQVYSNESPLAVNIIVTYPKLVFENKGERKC